VDPWRLEPCGDEIFPCVVFAATGLLLDHVNAHKHFHLHPTIAKLMVKIGKRYGYELDGGHIKDFLATVGIGLTSQVFEGFTRRLVGSLTRRLAGGLLGGLAGKAAGSAFAFATTYALGQVAKRYYASGRTLSTEQMKEVFASMLAEARSLQGRYSGDIAQRSRQVNVAELLHLVRQQ